MISSSLHFALLLCIGATLHGFINGQMVGSKDLFRCRQSCYQKFVQDWHHCMDFEDCKNMCITPPNINSYIPEAFSFLCWNNCDQQLGPFPLNINSALRQGSLVLTDIAWDQAITNASKQCLVTWEVSGGGLMGNLLTDSSTVELSLWPDTIYHVQVTCKHKETGGMRRSYKLIVDTHQLNDNTASGMQAIGMDTSLGKSHLYGSEQHQHNGANSAESDSRMRILKDSSKDFLSPYNPNAQVSDSSSSSTGSSKNTKFSNVEKVGNDDSVVRTKLKAGIVTPKPVPIIASEATTIRTQSIVFGVVGAAVICFVVLLVYTITRPARKDEFADLGATDKEILIRNEMLQNQTQTARVTEVAGPSTSTASVAVAVAPDSRTLHV